MSKKSKLVEEYRTMTDLDGGPNCSSIKSDGIHSTSYDKNVSSEMATCSETFVQYECDHKRTLTSERKGCTLKIKAQYQRKFSLRNRTKKFTIKGNIGTIFLLASVISSIVHVVLGQTIILDTEAQSASASKRTPDSSTITGINSIWEPSSDDANPSSITIIKITPTLAPMIEITPTTSTSRQKETSSSSATFAVGEKFSKETSASSRDYMSSSTVISPKKTSEKKIEKPHKESSGELGVITNNVTTVSKDALIEKTESEFQKPSKLLQEPDSNRIKNLDSAKLSSVSQSSRTTNEVSSNDKEGLQETSSNVLQISSLSSSSSLESVEGSSLEPTPLDLPTSWTSTNKQTESTTTIMTSNAKLLSSTMQTPGKDSNRIDLAPTGTTTTSSNTQNSFLVHKASREQQTFVRPVNLPRSSGNIGGAKIVDTPNLSVEEENSKFSLNQIKNKKDRGSKDDPSSLRKSTRQSDVNLSDQNSGSLSDILTGLLNVVGEGLSIATNYVKENQKKNAQKVSQDVAASKLSSSIASKKAATQTQTNPNIIPSRINNRGPPRFTQLPFEAIPLEVLSAQTPGQKPILQIKQRPFQTRFKVPKPSIVNKRKPPVYATGIPLPNLLIPESGLKRPLNFQTTKLPVSMIQSHSSNNIPQKDMNNKFDRLPSPRPTLYTGSNNKNGPIPGSGQINFPVPTKDFVLGEIKGEFDKEDMNNVKNSGDLNTKSNEKVGSVSSTTRGTLSLATTTTPKVQNKSYRPPTTFKITNQTPQQGDRPQNLFQINGQNQNQIPNFSTTNIPNVSFGTRRTPPLVSQGFQSRPNQAPHRINTTPNNVFEEIVTGRPGPRPGLAPRPTKDPNLFDVTVSADQNYGSNYHKETTSNNNGYQQNINNGYIQGPNIITKARPGNEFVSIDGKRTYFDIGPSVAPQPQGGYVRPVRQPAFNDKPNEIRNDVGRPQHHHPNALNTIRPPDLRQQLLSQQQGLSHFTQDKGLGSARPVEVIVGVDLNTGSKNSDSEFSRPIQQPIVHRGSSSFNHKIKSGPTIRPSASPVRIDTCIVGDDSTCEKEKHEVCKTKLGVSSCFCRPGYGRKNHRHKCKKIVRLLMSMQVDRINQQRLFWSGKYVNPNSKEYKTLEGESNYAIDSAMKLTSLGGVYLSNEINKFFPMNGKVTVNLTLSLLENSYTKSLAVKRDVQKKLIEVIQGRNSNIGRGNLYVDGPLNPIPGVADLNECANPEMHDCPIESTSDKRGREVGGSRCINRFGGFSCRCLPGWGDPFADDPIRSGRYCQTCDAVEHCSGRGICRFSTTSSLDPGGEVLKDKKDQNVQCECKGNFYGSHCEIDGEVMAVAVGASVAAVIIIILTLICLCMWSRRWKRDQQKAEIIRNFPAHTMAAYGGGTLPLATHPGIGGGSFLPAYVDGANYNKAAIIASQAAAIQRAASIAGSRVGSLINGSIGPYNNASALSPSGSQPPLPQVPLPPSSALEAERIRWSANQGSHQFNFNEKLKQNVYAQAHASPSTTASLSELQLAELTRLSANKGSSVEQKNIAIYSEPIYSYPTSPPVRGAQSNIGLSSPMGFHKHIDVRNNAANIYAQQMKKDTKQMNLYGTLPRAQIHRRQPLQRIDSENSETDDKSKGLPLTKATTFFEYNDEQDYYGDNNVDVNQNIQAMENSEQIINARNLGNYATFRYHPTRVPHPSYFQHHPSLLCGPMVPLHLGSPMHHPSLMSQHQSAPMSQWSRDDLNLILSTENGGGGLSGSSGRNKVLESKNHFKTQIRKLEHRQQKISRSFEQLVELTEPDDDEDDGSSLPSLVLQVPDTNNKLNFRTIDDKKHEFLRSQLEHEDDDLLNDSSSSNRSSSNRDSSENDESDTKTTSSSANLLGENDIIGSSTACLVSLDGVNSISTHDNNQPEEKMLSIHSKSSQNSLNDNPQETLSLNGALKSSKTCDNIAEKEIHNGCNASITSSISPKSGTTGKRSGANLTVTFDFDYEDRSIGNDITDTPRSHMLKDVPNFLQNKLFNPVKNLVTKKRLGNVKQHIAEKMESSKQKKSNLSSHGKSKNGVDVIRKKHMAPQPPTPVANTYPSV